MSLKISKAKELPYLLKLWVRPIDTSDSAGKKKKKKASSVSAGAKM